MNTPALHPQPQLQHYQQWLSQQHGLPFDSYEAMHAWSVEHLAAFWRSIWDYYQLESPTAITEVLSDDPMPHARWFSGAQVSLPRQLLRHTAAAQRAGVPAIISDNELGQVRELDWPELQRQVASVALALRGLGIGRGDRVAAYLPNIPETVVAMLACVSLGAIWSVCAPDMGVAAVVDRFKQIEPKALIAVDGVYYGGKPLDRSAVVQALLAELPTVQHCISVQSPYAAAAVGSHSWDWATTGQDAQAVAAFEPEWLPFDHPIWIVYSSGTTGLPKPIVHGTGGILLALHVAGLHNDLGASYSDSHAGERFLWYSSTGWVMWNIQVSGLLFGTTITIFDGHPAGSSSQPDWGVLWRFAARHHTTIFGAGAAYFSNCMKAGLEVGTIPACSRYAPWAAPARPSHPRCSAGAAPSCRRPVRVRSSGAISPAAPIFAAPLSAATAAWPRPLAACSAAGWAMRSKPGTNKASPCTTRSASWSARGPYRRCRCTSGTTRASSATAGQLFRPLARHLAAWRLDSDQRRRQLRDLWPQRCHHQPPGPAHGHQRDLQRHRGPARGAGFDGDRPGVPGPRQLYAAVCGAARRLGAGCRDQGRIEQAIRTALSPRFIPDTIVQVVEVPRTLTGKKLELPIKKLLLGQPAQQVLNPQTMANPGCLPWYEAFATQHLARHGQPTAG